MPKRRLAIILIVTLIVLVGYLLYLVNFRYKIFKYSADAPYQPVCSNKICESGENSSSCPTDCPKPVCVEDGVCKAAENGTNCPKDCAGQAISPEALAKVKEIWRAEKQVQIDSIKSQLSGATKNPYVLYNIQIQNNNLLTYAGYAKDTDLMTDIADLLLTAYDYLEPQNYYIYSWPATIGYPNDRRTKVDLTKPINVWTYKNSATEPDGFETVGPVSQFLYLASNSINTFLDIDSSKRTPKMNAVIEKYPEIILNEHYLRWIFNDSKIFQVKGWGCEPYNSPNFNHADFIKKKLNKELGSRNPLKYCNALTDFELWLISGATEMLSADKKDHAAVKISEVDRLRLIDYIKNASLLIKGSLTENQLVDFHGNQVKGLNFDLGVWDQHSDPNYSGYFGTTFPTESDKSITPTGWDVSHARRFVHVFESLYKNRPATEQTFPDKSVLVGLANQLTYGAFNKDFLKPLFTNYMNGVNGWYRVGYSGRVGFGYAPFDMSLSVASGGYGYWSKYNSDISIIWNSLWDLFHSAVPEAVSTVQNYYEKKYYSNFQRTKTWGFDGPNPISTLNYLVTLAAEANSCGNKICDAGENTTSCPGDCPVVNTDIDDTAPTILSINISEGQSISTNPFIIIVRVQDNIRVKKVSFFMNDVLIGESSSPDLDGNFEFLWDVSGSSAKAKVVVEDEAGNKSEITRNVSIATLVPIKTLQVLPKTGEP